MTPRLGRARADATEGQWITADPAVPGLPRWHESPLAAGIHQHYFSGVMLSPPVAADDVLFAMVWLDPDAPP